MNKKLRGALMTSCLAFCASSAQAGKVTVYVKSSDGTPIDHITIQRKLTSAPSYSSFGFSDAGLPTVKTLANGDYEIKATVNNTTLVKTVTVTDADLELNFITTALIYKSANSVGTALTFDVKYLVPSLSSPSVLGSGSSTITKQFFPTTITINSTYRGQLHQRALVIGGDGATLNTTADVNIFTTKVNFTSKGGSANEPVARVDFRYNFISEQNLNRTDDNGDLSAEVLPGAYTFKAYYKGTMGEYPTEVSGGDASAMGNTTNVDAKLTKVMFANSGSVKFTAGVSPSIPTGGTATVTASGMFLFPGTYPFLFRDLYAKDLTISGADYFKSAAIIIMKDNTGAALAADGIRGGVGASFGTWHVSDPTTVNGVNVKIDISNKSSDNSRSYEAKINNSTKVITQDLLTNNVFNFQSDLLTLNLKNCAGTAISGGSVRYGAGASYSTAYFPGGATNAAGQTSMQAFPGTFSFEMNINQTSEVKSSVIFTGSDSYTWNTTNLKFNYPHDIAYGGAGDNAYFTKSGTEVLPGSYKFNFRTSGALSSSNYSVVTIPASSCTAIEKTPVILRLVSSAGTAMEEGIASYYQNGAWMPSCYTKANGNIVVLLNNKPATFSSRIGYKFTTMQKTNVAVPANAILTFQTSAITMELKDADGNHTLEGNTLQYYPVGAGEWKTFGTGSTTASTASMELFPCTSSFSMKLNDSKSIQLAIEVPATATIIFNAASVKVNVTNNTSAVMENAAVTYYLGGWNILGNTDVSGNSPSIALLSGTTVSGFKAAKGGKSVTSSATTIGSGYQIVNLQINTSSAKTTQEDELLTAASNDFVSIYPNPTSNNLNITIPAAAGTVEIYALDGRKMEEISIENGSKVLDISSYASGVYNVVLKYDGKSSAHKISKQ